MTLVIELPDSREAALKAKAESLSYLRNNTRSRFSTAI
jgi:hypothetical protein